MNPPLDIYQKGDIISNLNQTFQEVSQMSIALDNEQFFRKETMKWSAAENLDHLIRSTKGLGAALKMPKLALRASFGKANRPSHTFSELIEKYQEKLKGGVNLKGSAYSPDHTQDIPKTQLLENWQSIGTKFNHRLNEYWTEEQMDQYIIPHPLLGKLTVREIMFFTIYHNLHHLRNMKNLFASFV